MGVVVVLQTPGQDQRLVIAVAAELAPGGYLDALRPYGVVRLDATDEAKVRPATRPRARSAWPSVSWFANLLRSRGERARKVQAAKVNAS